VKNSFRRKWNRRKSSSAKFTFGENGLILPFGLNSGIPGIGCIWNQLKLQESNRIPEQRGIPGHQLDVISTGFRELDGADSVDGIDSAIFNIAE
jgi:hypothetical protein